MSKEKKEYDVKLINDVVKLINDRDILAHDFVDLDEVIRDHYYYEKEEVNFEDVEDYLVNSLDRWERSEVLETLGVREKSEILGKFEAMTLHDDYRLELLMKLYKESHSITDLENMLKDSTLDKIKYTIL